MYDVEVRIVAVEMDHRFVGIAERLRHLNGLDFPLLVVAVDVDLVLDAPALFCGVLAHMVHDFAHLTDHGADHVRDLLGRPHDGRGVLEASVVRHGAQRAEHVRHVPLGGGPSIDGVGGATPPVSLTVLVHGVVDVVPDLGAVLDGLHGCAGSLEALLDVLLGRILAASRVRAPGVGGVAVRAVHDSDDCLFRRVQRLRAGLGHVCRGFRAGEVVRVVAFVGHRRLRWGPVSWWWSSWCALRESARG